MANDKIMSLFDIHQVDDDSSEFRFCINSVPRTEVSDVIDDSP